MKKVILLLMAVFIVLICGVYAQNTVKNDKDAVIGNPEPLQLSLDKCVKTALDNNNSVKIAESKIKENTFKVGEAKSGLYPQINLTPAYLRTEPIQQFDFNGASFVVGKKNNYDINLSLNQLIYSFGRLENSIAAAKLKVISSKLEKEANDNMLILIVKEDYYNVLRVKEFVKIATDSVKSNKDHLKTAQDFFKEGIVARYDVLRMETKVSESQQGYIRASNAVDLMENNLKNTMNMDLSTPIVINMEKANVDYITKLKDVNEFINTGLTYRPEAKETFVAIDMAMKLVKLAASNDKPNLNLVYNYDWKNPTGVSLPNVGNLAVAMSIPIFDGLNTQNMVGAAKENLVQMRVSADEVKNNITLDVRQSYLNFYETRARLDAAAKAVAEGKEALSIAEVRYSAGISTATELSDAQLAYDTASVNYAEALFDYKVAIAKLEKAVGGKQYFEKLIIR